MFLSRAAILFAVLLGALGTGSQTAPRQAVSIRQRLAAVLAAEEGRAATRHQLETLIAAVRDSAPEVQAAAARALGRLERRDVVPVLLPLLASRDERVRSEAANAVAQSFRGDASTSASSAIDLDAVLDALQAAPRSDGVYRAVGRLPYATVEQVREAEAFLRQVILLSDPPASAARGLESLGRRRPRLAPLEEATLERLRRIARRQSDQPLPADVRRNAMLALVAWQGADARTVQAALDDEEFEIRRLAALVLAADGSALAPEQRIVFLNTALRDRARQVRLEAVRSWARGTAPGHGCSPLVTALSDPDRHVVIAALDALGEACREDEGITDRLAAEARTPPTQGAWQREAHALLSLSKRSRERAAVAMPAFASHNDWQVRLYAARAAAAMDDMATLQRLASDPHDSVVEATLAPLRRRLGTESDGLFIAALNRRTRTAESGAPARPYQVFREAALQLKGAAGTGQMIEALIAALQHASAERCETSRDARLELVARIAELGSRRHASALAPLLRDIDPVVATAASTAIEGWTGKRPLVEPPGRRRDAPSLEALVGDELLTIEMENERVFRMAFYSEQAPLAKARITRLAGERFYDELTFHRVVPNFVIQGGSPNANEYCGDCPYMRDEVGLLMHVRGTAGISTRGRDTGDAQIFVNLVDSPRLDHEYTVFAYVCPADMPVVDRIQEGDRMTRVSISRGLEIECPPPR